MKTNIIAEAGVNHNGDINIAKDLVKYASVAGADYIKFQTFEASKLVSSSAKKADYQKLNDIANDESQFSMLKSLELSHDDHYTLIKECKNHNIKFLSSAFDIQGLEFLNSIGLDLFKVPSGELTNLPYLERLSSIGKQIILSTGMSNLGEIWSAMKILTKGISKEKITILHCNTEYPTPLRDVNLRAMTNISREFNCKVGYSDHTLGIEIPIAAVAMGATVIEKHFTLDRKLVGPDHASSLEPKELESMVNSIRNVELAISGNGEKLPSTSEKKNISLVRKSIHSSKFIKSGQIISEDDLIPLRPGDGISPMEWYKIIGSKAKHDIPSYHKIKYSDFS
jgi:N,N'-diacetyllegionaminate synthase